MATGNAMKRQKVRALRGKYSKASQSCAEQFTDEGNISSVTQFMATSRQCFIQRSNKIILVQQGGLVAQAVRRSPPTTGVPSSHLGPSMWVSWWTKRGLGRFFTGFGQDFHGVSPVFPYQKFHSTLSPHSSHPFRFISSALVMVHQAWSAGTLATHGPIIQRLHRISSLDPTLCWTRVEDIYFYYWSRRTVHDHFNVQNYQECHKYMKRFGTLVLCYEFGQPLAGLQVRRQLYTENTRFIWLLIPLFVAEGRV